MAPEHLVFLSVAGLRPGDIDRDATPRLYRWAGAGALAELVPTFPCVTSCVQATMWTGQGPDRHGVVANGFFHRDRRRQPGRERSGVAFWVGRNDVIAGEPIWDTIRASGSNQTSAFWHAQNIKGAGADFIVTPAPIHEPDGSTKLWCYSKPDGLYQQLAARLGHFPLHHYWGPQANIESTRWILQAAAWLIEREAPNFHWIYIPHLDYAAQKFGPDSPQAKEASVELDREIGRFADRVADLAISGKVVYLVAGEYALTDVSGAVYPNRILREAGLLAVREEPDGEHLDFGRSAAFAMADHQLAHVYVLDSDLRVQGRIAELFQETPGVAGVYAGDDRSQIGLLHPRSGEVVLVADDRWWFAYYWWLHDAAAPSFARTVDIHRKPGYDPVELFIDPATKGIPLDAGLVKGSHGAPATAARHRTALICSARSRAVRPGGCYSDTEVKGIAMQLLGLQGTG